MFRKSLIATVVAMCCLLAVSATPATASVGTAWAGADLSRPYPVTNNLNGRCLDAAWEHIGSNGTPVVLWDCYGPGQSNQQWYFRPVHHYYPEYQIVNKASGRCLDASWHWQGVNGTPIVLWDCYGPNQLNQIWYVYQDGYLNYTIQSKAFNRVLDANLGWGGANGTPIQLWDNLGNGQYNQRWRWL